MSGINIRIPDYEDKCITQLPAFFEGVLTGNYSSGLAKQVSEKMRLDGVKNVVFFLVDGFGYDKWQDYRTKYDVLKLFEEEGYVTKIDSVFPSSTPVALNALHNYGQVPAQHGLIDWWLYLKETDQIIATLPFAAMGDEKMDSLLESGVDPSVILSGMTTYQHFESEGIKSRVFTLKDYAQSVYTKTAYKGCEIFDHKDVSELFSNLHEQLNEPQEAPSFNFVYWHAIDAAGHQYGVDSAEHKRAIEDFFVGFDCFLTQANCNDDTLCVVSADHGQINVNPKETMYLDDVEGLYDLLKTSDRGKKILPWGGSRDVFLAVETSKIDEALALLHATIGDNVRLIRLDEALEQGLFGKTDKPHSDIRSRIGDIIVLPKGNRTVWYRHPGEAPFSLLGHHGGLSSSELEVPFGVLRLS
jgi:Type I phosphodiesterase / nucleotide pyrophosphatase